MSFSAQLHEATLTEAIDLKITKSKHGPTVRVDVSGKIGKGEWSLKGGTTDINIGLHPLDYSQIGDRLTLNRVTADGGGKKATYAQRRKVIDAIVTKLTAWAKQHKIKIPEA